MRGTENRYRDLILGLLPLILFSSSCGGEDSLDPALQEAISSPDVNSPINYLLGVEEGLELSAREQQALAEQAIADCMAEQGFQYFPGTPAAMYAEAPDTPRSLEQAREIGFGIHDGVRQIVESREESRAVDGLVDPNLAFQQSLSPDEVVAYETALSGIAPDEVDLSSGVPRDPQSGRELSPSEMVELGADGCGPKAYEEIAPVSSEQVSFFLSREYQELVEQINSDLELNELRDGWRRCMAATGHSYPSRQALLDVLYREADALVHEATESHHDLSDAETENRLEALAKLEIDLAQADWSCSADLRQQEPEIARRYEVRFIEENESLLLSLMEDSQ